MCLKSRECTKSRYFFFLPLRPHQVYTQKLFCIIYFTETTLPQANLQIPPHEIVPAPTPLKWVTLVWASRQIRRVRVVLWPTSRVGASPAASRTEVTPAYHSSTQIGRRHLKRTRLLLITAPKITKVLNWMLISLLFQLNFFKCKLLLHSQTNRRMFNQ